MKRKILATRWYTQDNLQFPTIGIVAAETDLHIPEAQRTWCAYIGTGPGNVIESVNTELMIGPATEIQQQEFIRDNGGKLLASEAAGIFPDLDITKYKRS